MQTKSLNGARPAECAVCRAFELVPFALAVCSKQGNILFANTTFRAMFGFESDNLNANSIQDCLAKGNSVGLLPAGESLLAPQIALLKRMDGVEFWGRIAVSGLNDAPFCDAMLFQFANIDTLKKDHDTLVYRESTWRNAIADGKHGVWDYYAKTDETYLSEGWKKLRGIPEEEVSVNRTVEWAKNIHPDDYERVMECNRKHGAGELQNFSYEYRERRWDGKWIWVFSRGRAVERDAQNRPTRVVGIDVDVTGIKEDEERRLLEIEQTYQKHLRELEQANSKVEAARKKASITSNQDPLTKLANRRAFSAQLSEITRMHRSEVSLCCFYLFLIDLDRFKPINDTYGHNTGDAVICKTASRIKSALCENAVVARLGGDEFGVILPCCEPKACEDAAREAAKKIVEAIAEPIRLSDLQLEIGASVGISRFPECGSTESLLLRRADIAMYEAKKDPESGIAFFTPSMEQRVISRAKLEVDVREAVLKREFCPQFQPIIDLESGGLSGFEILARWGRNGCEQIGPNTFLPIIEQFGMMPKFAPVILEKAVLAALDWPTQFTIAFNITANGVCSKKACDRILAIMRQYDFPPERLVVEVSEMAVVRDIEIASENMNRLRDQGVQFAIDDFGVGYSGLNYLRTLSFEILKLDRSFVSTMPGCSESRKIVRSVLSLADQFGMKTVAEGIETDEVYQLVRAAGFTHGQGYYFEKPVPAEVAQDLIQCKQLTPLKTG